MNRTISDGSRALLLMLVLGACTPGGPELGPGEERPDVEEAAITGRMIDAIRDTSRQRQPEGQPLRFNQAKGLGCFRATFSVPQDLPVELRQGLFAQAGDYPARVRLASATEFDDRRKDFRGLSIKVSQVEGDPLWGQPGDQDFVLNSWPALFAANPADFLAFIEATRDDKLWRYFVDPRHLYSLLIILKGREEIDNPLGIRYWSTTPYRFGDDATVAVKYSVRPCPGSAFTVAVERHEDFLSDAMRAQLSKAPACMEFMVQFQGDPVSMPVENAAITWDELESPFQPVARLTIEAQDFTTPTAVQACENLRFNPWQALDAHRPLGGINRVRRAVYSEIGDFRVGDERRGEE